jgi:hypothetical protein
LVALIVSTWPEQTEANKKIVIAMIKRCFIFSLKNFGEDIFLKKEAITTYKKAQ